MSYVKRIDVPDDKNVYFIGDIHGNFKLFRSTMRELGITDDDVLISCGDLIDRGDQNTKTLFEFLVKENRHMVLGNHDRMLIDSRTSREWNINWQNNGGDKTIAEIGYPGINHFSELLKKVPYVLEVHHQNSTVGVVHGGIQPGYNWEQTKAAAEISDEFRMSLLWDRGSINLALNNNQYSPENRIQPVEGIDYVIHGHTGVNAPFVFGNRVWIDTQYTAGGFTVAQLNNNKLKFYTVLPDSYGVPGSFIIKES